MRLNPYLYFNGQCEAAFKFYERCLGGKIVMMLTHEGTPAAEQVPPEWHKKILHARMIVGDTTLMASDAPPGHQGDMKGFSVTLGIDDPAEAERIFQALAKTGRCTCRFRKPSGRYVLGCSWINSVHRG
jgi:PhnB protein